MGLARPLVEEPDGGRAGAVSGEGDLLHGRNRYRSYVTPISFPRRERVAHGAGETTSLRVRSTLFALPPIGVSDGRGHGGERDELGGHHPVCACRQWQMGPRTLGNRAHGAIMRTRGLERACLPELDRA